MWSIPSPPGLLPWIKVPPSFSVQWSYNFFFYCSLLFLRIYRTHTSIPRASHYSSAGSCLAWVWQIIWLALHTLMMLSGHATPAPMPQFRFSLQLTPTKARSWVRTQISLWHHTNLPLGRPMYIPVAAPGAFSAMRLSHPARDLAQSLELPYLRAGLSCMPRELVPSSSPMPVKIAVCDLPWWAKTLSTRRVFICFYGFPFILAPKLLDTLIIILVNPQISFYWPLNYACFYQGSRLSFKTPKLQELRTMGQIFNVNAESIIAEMRRDFDTAAGIVSSGFNGQPLKAVWLDCVGRCCSVPEGQEPQVWLDKKRNKGSG